MTAAQTKHIIQILTDTGIRFDSALTHSEVSLVEAKYDFQFPPDLKLFLQTALPTSNNFVNWRLGLKSKKESDKKVSRINWPWEGMQFDIENNAFWVDSWGVVPDSHDNRLLIAKQHYEAYPKLIPICSHRYLPSRPCEIGNPVFSVHQMDIIYYGSDLANYLANEFHFTSTGHFELPEFPTRKIEFWSDIAEDTL